MKGHQQLTCTSILSLAGKKVKGVGRKGPVALRGLGLKHENDSVHPEVGAVIKNTVISRVCIQLWSAFGL
jgi:hypothetical protein